MLPEVPEKWFCFSSNHEASCCGYQTDDGHWIGDALDLEAHRRKQFRAAVLKADGYLVDQEPWDPPTPFAEFELPAFPTDALPDWLREYVEREAEATLSLGDCDLLIEPTPQARPHAAARGLVRIERLLLADILKDFTHMGCRLLRHRDFT